MSRDFCELQEAGAGTGSKMKRDFNRILIGISDSTDKGDEEKWRGRKRGKRRRKREEEKEREEEQRRERRQKYYLQRTNGLFIILICI